ncbi:hypothetical protein [Deinococcus roseus]|uniref:Uncharacterized protein n=1 Tax=Deinococcus roseus TaxID=392414 RepID=A0ABQ2CYY9_9DEIO|nr:hypothetical protein [Deinococcus roseus]GGJ34791.1 hypothetical protein GCM10008938_21220 [Deinococcus roseus]
MTPLQTLLQHIVDYAGLYPPAALPLPEVLRNYASYQHSEACWMLGRLVVNASHLPAFQGVRSSLPSGNWPLSVLAMTPEDWEMLAACLKQGLPVKAIETRAETAVQVKEIAARSRQLGVQEVYTEVPYQRRDVLEAIQQQGLHAKARTGGVVQTAFPDPDLLLQFIQDCVSLNLPFKLTAGLHHPVRGMYSLTYQPDSAKGRMYGYLNVLLATAFTLQGLPELAKKALLEEDQHEFHWLQDGLGYAGVILNSSELHRTRSMLHAFGSCSFTEPHDELLPFAHQRNP